MSERLAEKHDLPGWLTVGARVAAISLHHHFRSVRFAKVDRIGKRDIVLDNGERFRVRTLERQEGDTWNRRTMRLMEPSHPKVAEIRAEIRHANLLSVAKNACREFDYTGSVRGTTVTAADVILTLAPLTGVEMEIRALFERDEVRIPPDKPSTPHAQPRDHETGASA